jgi:hypothetical protein
MRNRTATRSATIGTLLAAVVLLSSAAIVLAKEGGIVTLAKPIPLDAEPGSTLTVEFDATMLTDDGRMPIDNNDVEQLMKQVAIGRRNWLFIAGKN